MTICKIKQILNGEYVMEGAGVKLKRMFGYYETAITDPFLLFDHFGSDDPADYIPGFPWHPHRGIETMTYMINGIVEHQDSLGNKGTIFAGDAQWMTAGSGIIHQEMPQESKDFLAGFQLWINLPKNEKMTLPKYREIKTEKIPEYHEDGIDIKILSGELDKIKGAAQDISGNPIYVDISMQPAKTFSTDIPEKYNSFCYLFKGEITVGTDDSLIKEGSMIVFDSGSIINITTSSKEARFVLFAGKPLGEPIAWRGPIVMNTNAELDVAFQEYYDGTFIKNK